ncbi:MAG: hypothetical protein AB1540_06300 [Bdellovibrionota bacterium]
MFNPFIQKQRLIILAAFISITSLARAEEAPRAHSTKNGHGFYYDSKSQQYFTNNKAQFSVRPIGGEKFIERIEVSVDDGNFESYSGKLSFSQEGPHILRFRAADPVLNWSPVQSFRVHVDLTPPSSSYSWEGISYKSGSTLYVSPNAKLSIVSQDNLSGPSRVLWKQDEKHNAKNFSGSAQFSREGEHHVQFAATDNVGNQESWKELSFIVDGKAPETQAVVKGVSYQKGKEVYFSSGSYIVLEAKDGSGSGVQTIEYQLEDGAISTYTQPIMMSGSRMNLRYRGVDLVGNRESWKTMSVQADLNPPRLAVREAGRYVSVSGKIFARPGFTMKAEVQDFESGIREIAISRDGKSFDKAIKAEFTFDKEGEYQFAVEARDHVGNLTRSDPYVIVIDSTPPVSDLKTAEALVTRDNVFLSSLPNSFSVHSTDHGVGVDRIEVSYDGKHFTPLTQAIDLATWKDARQTIYYRAVDRLENKEQARSMTLQVLTQGPKVDLFVESENLPNVPLSNLLRKYQQKGEPESERAPASSR